jgi:hypothetical protein
VFYFIKSMSLIDSNIILPVNGLSLDTRFETYRNLRLVPQGSRPLLIAMPATVERSIYLQNLDTQHP